jgi:hypothetical protein
MAPIQPRVDWRVAFGGALLFVAASHIPPLYESNQNTKFLHAFAYAFPDRLGADWMATTVDGLPAFSGLVYLVARFAHPLFFYGAECLLLFALVAALLTIAVDTARRPTASLWLEVAIAGALVAIATIVSLTRLFRGVADQGLIDGYLQPSEFGVFFVVALALALRGWGGTALLVAALPAAFHPAYVTIAAVLILAMVVARWRDSRSLPSLPLTIAVLAILILPSADLAFRFAPTDPATFEQALDIVAHERIPYHSDPSQWFRADAVAKLLIAVAALALAPPGLLRIALGWLLISVVVGTLLVVFTGHAGLSLVAPWRASVVIVPVSIVILLARLLDFLDGRLTTRRARMAAVVPFVLIALVGAGRGLHAKYKSYLAASPPDYIQYVREHHDPTDLYLTDISDSTFRLAAMAAQFVSWKTHPYLDTEVIEWRRRVDFAQAVFAGTGDGSGAQGINCAALRLLLDAYPVTHVLVDPQRIGPNAACDFLLPWFSGNDGRILHVDRSLL